ncbi:calcium-binding protein [Donghicola sp. C2-DW-16]|uniref:Calcium-binding protein n=1 Tax=Donghicola mangrovi TaxID=2729614 RepID=A0ABX2PBR8_9RHOB|nr:calcium-binding protein [Donghicola mangrovi]NVO26920.1 calcium-binding protein [Donghicola mangrovi]
MSYGIYNVLADQYDWNGSDNSNGSEDESYHDDGQTEDEAHNGSGSTDDQSSSDGSDSSSNSGDDGSSGDGSSDIIGDENDDDLSGTEGDDTIDGMEGDDTLTGGAGADWLSGYTGDDALNGEGWRDVIDGGSGSDTLDGGNAEDLLYGGEGADTLLGGGQADTLFGGNGDDMLDGQNGNDFLIDISGDNTLVGGTGGDVIISTGDFNRLGTYLDDLGTNTIFSELANGRTAALNNEAIAVALDHADASGADLIEGGAGYDMIAFGPGDTASGGEGSDYFAVVQHQMLDGASPATITDYEARDTVEYIYSATTGTPDLSIEETDTGVNLYDGETLVMEINGDTEGFTLDNITLSSLDAVNTNDGDDDLTGGSGDDVMFLQDGDDRASGEAGDDILVGGDGKDTLSGGAGDDQLKGGDQADKLNGGTGDDTLNGTAADDIHVDFYSSDGEGFADIVFDSQTRSDGTDLLDGGYGDDLLLVGAGDTAIGGEGDDLFVLIDHDGGAQIAVVEDFNPAEDYLMVKYWGSATPELTASVDADGYTVLALDGKDLFLIKTVLPEGYDILNAVALEHFSGAA